MLDANDQFGTEGIALHVPQDGRQVIVVLDGEGFESTLPHMSGRAVMTMISSGVGGQEPLHPASQVAIRMRPEHDVEVIGHQAVAEEVDRYPPSGIGHGLDEGVIIRRLVEHRLPAIAAIQGVINHPANKGASGARHRHKIIETDFEVKNALCPPFPCPPFPPGPKPKRKWCRCAKVLGLQEYPFPPAPWFAPAGRYRSDGGGQLVSDRVKRLVRKLDAGNRPVRFDERGVETGSQTTSPLLDSTQFPKLEVTFDSHSSH